MSKKTILLCFFILLKFVLQYFAIDTGYELHRDEYLHVDLGNHLDWGYSSVPPVTGWISFIIISFGKSVFWVKFFPALFGALTIFMVWKITEELKGGIFALVLGAACITFSVLLRINTLYQPNSLEFLLWTVLFYTLIKFINTEDNKWLWYASLTFAFGFLNKYNITFMVLGLLPAMLITSHRKIFLNKHLYLSLLVALIIVSPNLVWQYNNDFPVIGHLSTLAETQLVNVDRLDFLKDQILFFIGGLFVIFAAFVAFFKYPPFKQYRVFFWSYIFTIVLFLFFRAKGYYAIGLYPVLIAFGAVYLDHILTKNWMQYLKPIVILIPMVAMIPLWQYVLPVLSPEEIIDRKEGFQKIGLLTWEDGVEHDLPQDFADMLGWRELAGIVDEAFEKIEDKEHTLIHCDAYGHAGAINFYGKQKYTEAVALNADYINWYPLDEMEIRNVILVKESDDDDVNREREKTLFEKVSLVGEVKNKFAREYGAKVFLLEGATQSINEIFREEIKERRNQN